MKTLPARDRGFDAIVSGLVLNFVPRVEAALESMRDRLRPGGVVAAYVWDYAQGMEFLRHFWDEAVASDSRASDLDKARRSPLCRPATLASLFRGAGLATVETGALDIETTFETFDDHWIPFLRGTGPAPSHVASLEPSARASLRERLARRLGPGGGGRIRLRACAWVVRGVD